MVCRRRSISCRLFVAGQIICLGFRFVCSRTDHLCRHTYSVPCFCLLSCFHLYFPFTVNMSQRTQCTHTYTQRETLSLSLSLSLTHSLAYTLTLSLSLTHSHSLSRTHACTHIHTVHMSAGSTAVHSQLLVVCASERARDEESG